MIKTYNIFVNILYLPNMSGNELVGEFMAHYDHVKSYWAEIGGIIEIDEFEFAYYQIGGTNEILAEFILTYPYSQYINIKEII